MQLRKGFGQAATVAGIFALAAPVVIGAAAAGAAFAALTGATAAMTSTIMITSTILGAEAAVVGTAMGVAETVASLPEARFTLPLALPGAAAISLGRQTLANDAVDALPALPSIERILGGEPYQDWMAVSTDDGTSLPQSPVSVSDDAVMGPRPGVGPALTRTTSTGDVVSVDGADVAGTTAGVGAGSAKTVYVGGFKRFKYDGSGCMYLPCARVRYLNQELPWPPGFQAFKGEFKEGRFSGTGTVYSPLRGGAVATVTFLEDGTLNRCVHFLPCGSQRSQTTRGVDWARTVCALHVVLLPLDSSMHRSR
jgi:hypothetical protein